MESKSFLVVKVCMKTYHVWYNMRFVGTKVPLTPSGDAPTCGASCCQGQNKPLFHNVTSVTTSSGY